MSRLAAILLPALLSVSALAARPLPPSPQYYVLDEPRVLSPATTQALQSLLVEHDHATGEQIVFAIFNSLEGEELVDWTNRVFAEWRIGKRGKDNGVLLALYWQDRKARIEVGYGLEALLTDAKAKRVIEDFLVPELKQGSPDRALSLSVLEILATLESPLVENGRAQEILRSGGIRGDWAPVAPSEGAPAKGWAVWVIVGLILFAIAWNILASADAHFTGGGWYRPNPWRRARRQRDLFWGGWGGGGGFMGGGGRSGGGGASGSW